MEGYWLLWCICIITIFCICGYKQTMLAYVAMREVLIYGVVILVVLLNEYPLFIFTTGHIQFYNGAVFVVFPIAVILFSDKIKEIGLFLISVLVLSLMYCLVYTLYLLFRGYEPSNVDWLIYVIASAIVSVLVLKKNQLFSAIILANVVAVFVLSWHQQGQYQGNIGSFSWWEFNVFVTVSVVCLVETTKLFINGIKFIYDNTMKS